jgi:hypothetical protein
MQIDLKMGDVFYNNGITNIFWATRNAYDVEYAEMDSSLQIEAEGVKLILKPFILEIKGEDNNIRKWYRKASFFLIDIGLSPYERIVYHPEDNILEVGYSYIKNSFADRTWKPQHIEHPCLLKGKKLKEHLPQIETLLKTYPQKTGKNQDTLIKEKRIKKEWKKKGFFKKIAKKQVVEHLLRGREYYNKGSSPCNVCGSDLTITHSGKFDIDSAVLPSVIGKNYAGFKEFAQSENVSVVCAFCDLILRYNFFWTFYAKANKTIVLHVDIPDLITLFKLKEGIFNIAMEDISGEDIKQSTNIPYQGFYLSSTERAILATALFVYKQIKEGKADENLQLLFDKKRDFIQVAGIFFDAQGIYQFIQYHQLSKFLDFLDSLSEIKSLSNSLTTGTFSLIKGEHKDLYEKSLLSNLLEFHPIAYNLSEIAFLKIKGDIYPSYLGRNFEEMMITFHQFLKKEESMEKEVIELIRKYGWALGTIAKAIKKPKGDPGVFYELRDVKRIEQFIKVLRDFSFRMIKKAEELKGQFDIAALNTFTGKDQEFINLLYEKEDRWEEIRNLLIFFSVNTYLKGMPSGIEQNSLKQEV